jgi:hypothetical protein
MSGYYQYNLTKRYNNSSMRSRDMRSTISRSTNYYKKYDGLSNKRYQPYCPKQYKQSYNNNYNYLDNQSNYNCFQRLDNKVLNYDLLRTILAPRGSFVTEVVPYEDLEANKDYILKHISPIKFLETLRDLKYQKQCSVELIETLISHIDIKHHNLKTFLEIFNGHFTHLYDVQLIEKFRNSLPLVDFYYTRNNFTFKLYYHSIGTVNIPNAISK